MAMWLVAYKPIIVTKSIIRSQRNSHSDYKDNTLKARVLFFPHSYLFHYLTYYDSGKIRGPGKVKVKLVECCNCWN